MEGVSRAKEKQERHGFSELLKATLMESKTDLGRLRPLLEWPGKENSLLCQCSCLQFVDHIAMRVLTLFIVLADIALVIASIFDSDENQHIYTIISVVVVSYFLIEVRWFSSLRSLKTYVSQVAPFLFWNSLNILGNKGTNVKSYINLHWVLI